MLDLSQSVQDDLPPYLGKRKREWAGIISLNNFDAILGESSDSLPKEAFQRTYVQLNLSICTAGVKEGWSQRDCQEEYQSVLLNLSDGLIDGDGWYKDSQYLYSEDRIVVHEAQLDVACSGPIQVQGTKALTALLTSLGCDFTPD